MRKTLLVGVAVGFIGAFVAPAPADAQGVTDPNISLLPADIPDKPVGIPFEDTVFGTTLTRLTGAGQSGSFGTHIYSQLQAFSLDNLYVLLVEDDYYVVRRVADLSLVVAGLDSAEWNAPRWQPAVAHTIIHYDTNGDSDVTVQYTNVDTLVTTDVYTFPAQYERISNSQSFDELSRDGRWVAGVVVRNDGARVIFALDLSTMTLGAALALPDLYAGSCQPHPIYGELEPDWIGISPLGNYLVVQWERDGTARCSGLETFNPATGAFVGRVYDGHQHGDLGLLADGTTEIFMTTEFSSPMDSNRPALAYRLLPGTTTVSQPVYLGVLDWEDGDHISCQGPPGVCLYSHGGWAGDGWRPFEHELVLHYMDGSVLRLAHHRSSQCGYWVQPRASLSRDASLAVFASDWDQQAGSASCGGGYPLGRGDAYLVDIETSGVYCGNGSLEEGEQCDDGNTTNGDGCDVNCTFPSCGNGIVASGEECDDGNATSGDCCSPTCQFEPFGNPCPDADVCNGEETCNGTGLCVPGLPLCDDGNICTLDTCDSATGSCTNSAPGTACLLANKALLRIIDRSDDARDRLKWKWAKGDVVSEHDLGDPITTTDYGLCIYDYSADIPSLVASLNVVASGDWRSTGGPGFAYKGKTLSADGVQKAKLKAGLSGKSKAELNAKGVNLSLPAPATAFRFFNADQRVTVQLVNSDGKCWSSEFSARDTQRNRVDRFQAKLRS